MLIRPSSPFAWRLVAQDLPPGHRPRGDHHHRPRPPRADDVRHRRAAPLNGPGSGSATRRSRSALAKGAPGRRGSRRSWLVQGRRLSLILETPPFRAERESGRPRTGAPSSTGSITLRSRRRFARLCGGRLAQLIARPSQSWPGLSRPGGGEGIRGPGRGPGIGWRIAIIIAGSATSVPAITAAAQRVVEDQDRRQGSGRAGEHRRDHRDHAGDRAIPLPAIAGHSLHEGAVSAGGTLSRHGAISGACPK